MKVGDLVRMRASIQPPRLYGIGIIMKTTFEGRCCWVRWSELPDRELKGCAPHALELVSAAG